MQNKEMETMIQMLRFHLDVSKHGTGYEMAETLDIKSGGDLMKNEILPLFFRVNSFEPKSAAKQIISFYEMKLWLFGRDKLNKDITIDDLNEDDRESLQSGSMQVLRSVTDTKNRRIILCLPGRRVFRSIENELRAHFYTIMSTLKLPEVKKNGIVMVCHSIGKYKDAHNGFGYAENSRLLSSLPIQIASIHHCVDDYEQFVVGITTAANYLSPSLNAKVKIHSGSEMECLFALFKSGIPRGCLPPADGSDSLWMSAHLAWCNSRLIFDLSQTTTIPLKHSFGGINQNNPTSLGKQDGVNKPRELDVLFGADHHHKSHPGNAKFHMLIDHLQKQYEEADKDEKIMISLIVVFSMKGTGSRFLEYDIVTQRWRKIPDTRARNKVTKIIRNRRRYKTRNPPSR